MVSAKPKPLGLDLGLVTKAHTDTSYIIEAQLMKHANTFSGAAGNAIRFALLKVEDNNGYVVKWAGLHTLASSQAAGTKPAHMKGISVQPGLGRKDLH